MVEDIMKMARENAKQAQEITELTAEITKQAEENAKQAAEITKLKEELAQIKGI